MGWGGELRCVMRLGKGPVLAQGDVRKLRGASAFAKAAEMARCHPFHHQPTCCVLTSSPPAAVAPPRMAGRMPDSSEDLTIHPPPCLPLPRVGCRGDRLGYNTRGGARLAGSSPMRATAMHLTAMHHSHGGGACPRVQWRAAARPSGLPRPSQLRRPHLTAVHGKECTKEWTTNGPGGA